MSTETLWEQAEDCRRRAHAYLGQPEGQFLLKVAAAFEDLASKQMRPGVGATKHRAGDTPPDQRR